MSPEEDRTRDAVDSEPKHYQLSYSGPKFLVSGNIILNLRKEMHIPLRPLPKEDSLRRWRFKELGNWRTLADQITWYMEGNSAEFTSSGNC